MWLPLEERTLVETFRRQPFPSGSPSPVLVCLLERLQRLGGLRGVFAVTGMGQLSLTTAPHHGVQEAHDSVAVFAQGVAYFEAGSRRSTSGRWCREEELLDLVECHLLRLLRHE
ncbi:hypothetical protein FJV41_39995 [Myxococcus llanfairpwllgwyngyllgogerychwyrndrobwllllantysiliogogogochensis]|uniref:Uncharacterized protein n=1 Tax=Myxococcus llanfairpwllgwyngyllgogerychwyrndrobwllllantysiliogogogochensis TaxID=2590453 RepID=A0A540WMV3_9BACT|nr:MULTISPECIES: hypothetical protein [Myxococcus]NTX36583.1 hypothetical protein [Myxococcus sp. CA033]TQF10343.1 hypothetical protein FJV41_39995 [Myxococcus llanfairpwllgwyngyllgogerychwyrndrobwllllantysiliogogogochensis]